MVKIAPFGSFEQIQSLALRHDVLRKPLGLEYNPDDLLAEESQIHIVFQEEHRVVGVLLLYTADNHTYKMRQVAVSPSVQKRGVGAALVAFAEKHLVSIGGNRIELHARWNAIPFYEKNNYITDGEVFEEVGIPHKFMYKDLV
jgi:predicted GNAT family N-acyltransferase